MPRNCISSPTRFAENMVENCAAPELPVESISPLIILYTGPVAIMTGRKNMALARALPRNFWLSMTAMNSENISISGVFQRVSRSTLPRYSV